ncbi:D-Ala-D-Ala carboxypeptidase family metallohydrolase [Desulfovibrio sp. OttesenSCG-928-C06]|nr:D-Ala-D-Ala carboxypeptidase family metallohydrolase [Desulfovibrio sp. OttesenSCG-928-C06]
MPSLFAHYSEYGGTWPWVDFAPREVSCRHCGELYLAAPELWALQRLRTLLGRPIVLNSAHRCVQHNAVVGGAPASRHLGLAFDCRCPADGQEHFCRLARQAGFTGIGRYPGRGFVHLDLGPARAWWG